MTAPLWRFVWERGAWGDPVLVARGPANAALTYSGTLDGIRARAGRPEMLAAWEGTAGAEAVAALQAALAAGPVEVVP
jgi:hypothetical protein